MPAQLERNTSKIEQDNSHWIHTLLLILISHVILKKKYDIVHWGKWLKRWGTCKTFKVCFFYPYLIGESNVWHYITLQYFKELMIRKLIVMYNKIIKYLCQDFYKENPTTKKYKINDDNNTLYLLNWCFKSKYEFYKKKNLYSIIQFIHF